jgi:hypothetical protein
VAPQSGAKDQSYYTVYYITLNLNCEAQRVSENNVIIVEAKINVLVIRVYFLCFKGKKLFLKVI